MGKCALTFSSLMISIVFSAVSLPVFAEQTHNLALENTRTADGQYQMTMDTEQKWGG